MAAMIAIVIAVGCLCSGCSRFGLGVRQVRRVGAAISARNSAGVIAVNPSVNRVAAAKGAMNLVIFLDCISRAR